MNKISIILPTFNEAENIVPLIKTIQKVVKNPKEILIIDDNSPDGTASLAHKYKKQYKAKNISVIVRYKNRGLTNSIRDGIKHAKGDIVVWMDCDFSHPPKMINKLVEKINDGYDIAVCSRFIKGGGFKGKEEENLLAMTLSRLMNYTIQFILNRNFKDYTSGFIAAKKSIFKKIKLRGDYGEYFIDLIYKSLAYDYKITEIPFINMPRAKGQSKTGNNLFDYIMRGRKYIMISFKLLIEKHIQHKLP